MSTAAGERELLLSKPPLPQHLPVASACTSSPSRVRTAPWVRIILSKLYFTHFFMPLLLISLLHRQRGSNRIPRSRSLSFYSTSFSLVLPLLYPHRQIDFLHLASFITPAIFNSPRSPSKEPPLCLFPALVPPQPLPHPHACLSGEFGREKGAVIKDKDESEQGRNKQANK